MQLTKKNWIVILEFSAIIIVLYVLLKIFLVPVILSDSFKAFVANIGVGGYFIVMGYTVLSHIFAPLSGTPGVLLGVAIYGIRTGMILLYVASLVSAIANFYISRRYGRRIVTKLIGEKAMVEVDDFTSLQGVKALFGARILGFSAFEFISYAAGLTSIPFRTYFLVTVITSFFTHFLSYLLFSKTDFQSEMGIMIWVGFMVGTSVLFGILIKAYVKNRKKS